MNFNNEEINYYEKNLKLESIGIDGQEKIKAAKVLVLGAGGLGSPALLYLATAGVGNIGIVDFDTVSISNLHRQILYTFADLGKPKSAMAKKRLETINPFINIKSYNVKITAENINDLIEEYDIILDAPDNFETRYIIEKACTQKNKIIIHASVSRFQGQVTVFTPETACYSCIFPNNPNESNIQENQENKIFGPLTGIIGTMQAIETIKVILSIGKPLTNTLLCYNALDQSIKKINFSKNKNCIICSNK